MANLPPQDMTTEDLRSCIITLDGKGKEFKELCLNELIDRARDAGGES